MFEQDEPCPSPSYSGLWFANASFNVFGAQNYNMGFKMMFWDHVSTRKTHKIVKIESVTLSIRDLDHMWVHSDSICANVSPDMLTDEISPFCVIYVT